MKCVESFGERNGGRPEASSCCARRVASRRVASRRAVDGFRILLLEPLRDSPSKTTTITTIAMMMVEELQGRCGRRRRRGRGRKEEVRVPALSSSSLPVTRTGSTDNGACAGCNGLVARRHEGSRRERESPRTADGGCRGRARFRAEGVAVRREDHSQAGGGVLQQRPPRRHHQASGMPQRYRV